jgi:hypothetical protein
MPESFIEVASSGSGYTPLIPLGTIQQVNPTLYGGVSEVVRLYVPANQTAIKVGQIVTWNSSWQAVSNPVTQYTGAPLAFSINNIPNVVAYAQYAWFAISGNVLVLCDSPGIAADTVIGISSSNAGKAAASSAGRQIVGAIVRTAHTQTVAKNANLKQGSTTIKVANTSGWFVGLPVSLASYLSGGTTITAIDQDDQTVTLSAAALLSGYVSITGTYNDGSANYWPTIACNRPCVQGAVT